ncbi:hypothetical protein HPB51_015050 [Rhipicephalus microplus]|uniref:Uncharacterized protein n=1 Tax=Rhipicephalus microplus TaxID=6941 RepID=A0A9J6EU49_RHIMP|nr:hypothetical protein HPB51_015050 [Rhipicephalus microplus]
MLAEYLSYNQTLRVLSVKSYSISSYDKLRPIIGALCYNSSLFELNLNCCSFGIDYFEAIADMLRRNRTLRKFHMIDCSVSNYDPRPASWKRKRKGESSIISQWSRTLAENKALEELTLDLRWIKPEECSSLFKALASNKYLTKVTIDTFPDEQVAHICRALRDTHVPERFFVGKHHLSGDTIAVLSDCKEISRICLENWRPTEVESLHTTLCVLPTCDHVKFPFSCSPRGSIHRK